ncbi:(d)CMP kinase [Vagococcus fluvialis]|uniref:Cytidylate kinase n=1 Tax=Vagococcus fluvialis TaxID=2738 RepID=A0A369B5E9_9ENTE|nr:(d)CMP kinase [Vagococcus fluvialis]OTP29414.1 cytidylate kinase [Enterococcus sp. 6C8_DIV0013]MBO0418992.1 (d)CMP kinase [Vagococcus fluvialis]MBO0428191.1 (d)CMP kinase [Vagococcus fluvialis]MBO0444090.1 (d)CMP kinase [Vagococcus fluvialis]MBO0478968.1 (d)CMP kinase [Vagococcus fluvialis]
MNKKIQIAIDGPASAGKSTVAKILAKKNGYIYCDTGAMYRALTLAAINNKIDMDSEEALMSLLSQLSISFTQEKDGQHVHLNEKDVTNEIRSNDVTNSVSKVSAYKTIREEMVIRQQKFADSSSIVMDGRDIGTVVLPNADLKIFLVASVTERAERRYKENLSKGIESDFEKLKQEIADRDHYDSTRKNSPLVQAEDAILVDTSGLTIDEVVEKIEKLMKTLF